MLAEATLPKRYRDGTHRLVPPAETLARLQPLLARLGITRVANVTGLDRIGIPVVMACRPLSRSISVAQGKGLDLDAAKVSAIMESLEAHHAERIRLPLRLASYEGLLGTDRVIEVDKLPRSFDSRFHRHLPLLWVRGRDWISGEDLFVPFQMVHTAYTADMRFDLNSFLPSSSGLAAGNHLIEAASHAVCEAIERDAYWRFTQLPEESRRSLRLDLESVNDPHCRRLLELFFAARVSVAAWDITGPTGVPAFFAIISESDEDPVRRLYAAAGSGCHPARHIALSRALTEAAQSRLTAISGARDDKYRHQYLSWRAPGTLAQMRAIAGDRGVRNFEAAPSMEGDTLEQDLERELAAVRRAGFDRVVVTELMLPEFEIPVVRVLIPGMHSEGGRTPVEATP
jgi:ribosomal protein S12 methylthiotransferase accessory factor